MKSRLIGILAALLVVASTGVLSAQAEEDVNVYLQKYEQMVDSGHSDSREAAICLHRIGCIYGNMQQMEECAEYLQKAYELTVRLFREDELEYVKMHHDMANLLSILDMPAEAEIMMRRSLEYAERYKNELSYPVYLYNMGRILFMQEKKKEAMPYFESALPDLEADERLFENAVNCLGDIYMTFNLQDKINDLMLLIENYNRSQVDPDSDKLQDILDLAQLEGVQGNHAEAKKYFIKAFEKAVTDEEVMLTKSIYAQYLADNGNYQEAAENYLSVADMIGDGEERYLEKAEMTANAALNFFLGKQLETAIECYRRVTSLCRPYNADHGFDALFAENDRRIADCYAALSNPEEALHHYHLAEDYYEKDSEQVEAYAKVMNSIANLERREKNYEEALAYYEKVIPIFKNLNLFNDYSLAIDMLNQCNMLMGKPKDSDVKKDVEYVDRETIEKMKMILEQEKSSLENTKRFLGDIYYARSLSTIAGCEVSLGHFEEGIRYYSMYLDEIRNVLRNRFQYMTSGERIAFWKKESSNIYDISEMLHALPETETKLKGELAALVYDSRLLSKGILLQSSIRFDEMISRTGNPELIDLYAQIGENEEKIESLRGGALSSQEQESILKMTRFNQNAQLRLYEKCPDIADFTDYIGYDWEDVQKSLGKKDVAIEFAVCDQLTYYDTPILAVVIDRKMKSPELVVVCSLDDARKMSESEEVYEMENGPVWDRLASYLEGKERIFFSADGDFNHVGIEYFRLNGKIVSEAFDVYRLSSTKQLCMKNEDAEIESIALFGDVNYNDMSALMTDDADQSETRGQGEMAFVYPALAYTKEEVEDIASICSAHDVDATLFMRSDASEKNFKELSEGGYDIIHVATHGEYRNIGHASEDEAMDNSILVFAGANMASDDLENDGLITAAEASAMNLRGCSLVCLSACETALGEQGTDGVFGLQRGFKNAGVQTLMMSVGSVSDAITARMMSAFYTHFLGGENKREAFIHALSDVRQIPDCRTSDWTAFILLDAF